MGGKMAAVKHNCFSGRRQRLVEVRVAACLSGGCHVESEASFV